jgi:hypothetical protein
MPDTPKTRQPSPPGKVLPAKSLDRILHDFLEELADRRLHFHEQRVARAGTPARESWELSRRTAQAIIRAAGELASDDSVPELRRLLRASAQRCCRQHRPDLVRLLDEEVCLWLGRKFCDLMPQASARLWSLLPLTQAVKPHWRSAAFLKRVSRCYIFGFDAECLIMCRSVLEGAFEAAVSDSDCRRLVGNRQWASRLGHSVFDLHTRIAVAVRLGRISQPTADDAEKVRAAARQVVHRKPRVLRDPLNYIKKTVAIVGELAKTDESCASPPTAAAGS